MAIRTSSGGWVYRRVRISGLTGLDDPVEAAIVLTSEGRYRLYYIHFRPKPTLHSAISDDGISFTEEAGARFEPTTGPNDPTLLRTPSGWTLWTGPLGQNWATSTDGLNFTRQGEFRINGQLFMPFS